MKLERKINRSKWEQEHREALAQSILAYAEVQESDKIEELHARVAVCSKARIRFDAAQDKLTMLANQWGQGCWRNQAGEIVEHIG